MQLKLVLYLPFLVFVVFIRYLLNHFHGCSLFAGIVAEHLGQRTKQTTFASSGSVRMLNQMSDDETK